MRKKSGPISGQKRQYVVPLLAALVLLAVGVGTAQAHRVIIFAWIEGNTVHTQSKFPGDRAVSKGEITVRDRDGQALLTGQTDDKGAFAFGLNQITRPGPLEIIVSAGMGHQGSWTLTAEEIAEAMGAQNPAPDNLLPAEEPVEATPADRAVDTAAASGGPLTPGAPTGLTVDQVERIVENALDRKLAPVTGMLIDIQEKMAIGLDDVVSGIGYILGLAGIAAYAYSRREKD